MGRQFGKKIIALVDKRLRASPVIEQVTTYHTVNFTRQGDVKVAVRRFVLQNLRSIEEVYDEYVALLNTYRHADVAAKEVMGKRPAVPGGRRMLHHSNIGKASCYTRHFFIFRRFILAPAGRTVCYKTFGKS